MIRDDETGWAEATVVINGEQLSFAEAMTLRVALTSFRLHLNEPASRKLLGAQLADGYDKHASAVEGLMVTGRR